MGFLSEGKALAWKEAETYADYIREEGLNQFLSVYRQNFQRDNDPLTWGDEIEYQLVHVNHEEKATRLCLRAPDILDELFQDEKTSKYPKTCWRPEYGSFMLESLPGTPYCKEFSELLRVQANMELRRETANALLKPNERVMSLTSYPMMGVGCFTTPPPPAEWTPGSDVYAASLFIQDQIINPHPRFGTLSANIRTRKGSTVDINIPLFQDTKTKAPQYGTEYQREVQVEEQAIPKGAKENSIYLDAMAFGMGCCCLQTTFQCRNIAEARILYDQLAPLCPIMMAISASAPIFRGYLANHDVRWNVIASAVDDRSDEERGLVEGKVGKFGKIPKSRYDSISLFISPDTDSSLNDIEAPRNEGAFKKLQEGGLDEKLAAHISHLFIRDPLVIYDNHIELDAATHSDHFENIQSTNWQTVRFKPPVAGSPIGWRIEFRSIEVQLTEYENAAFAVFILLVTRAILHSNLRLCIPISKIDENMKRAHQRDAVNRETFFFRQNWEDPADTSSRSMDINEIINGKEDFPGLIHFVNNYLDSTGMDPTIRTVVDKYVSFISKRASGEYMTAASWMRKFVTSHPSYQQDSVVTHEINYDLLEACHSIVEGKTEATELLPLFADRKLPSDVSPITPR